MSMIALICISFLLLIYGLFPYFWYIFYRPFIAVPIEVIKAKMSIEQQANRYSHTEIFVVYVKYNYCVDGERYSSTRVGLSDGLVFQDRIKAEEMSSSLSSEKSCFVSRKNPKKALLWKKFTAGSSNSRYAAIAASIALAAIAIAIDHI